MWPSGMQNRHAVTLWYYLMTGIALKKSIESENKLKVKNELIADDMSNF